MIKISTVPAFRESAVILPFILYFTNFYGTSQSNRYTVRPEDTMMNKMTSWSSKDFCIKFFLSSNGLFYTNFSLYNWKTTMTVIISSPRQLSFKIYQLVINFQQFFFYQLNLNQVSPVWDMSLSLKYLLFECCFVKWNTARRNKQC